MGKWNYRVVRKDNSLAIHEAYYNDEGMVHSLSEMPVSPICDNLEELESVLELMKEAVQENIIEFETLNAIATDPNERKRRTD